MPGKHSPKQERQAAHIKQSEVAAGKSPEKAESIAWATVNKQAPPAPKAPRGGKK